MRFVRIFTRADTGESVLVIEQETPFTSSPVLRMVESGVPIETEMHELGMADHFDPVCAETGEKCPPSLHLFQRIERHPDAVNAPADPTASALAQFRAKTGYEHEVPDFTDVPTSLSGLKQRLRAHGALPAKARAWLALTLAPDDVQALGAGAGIPVSVYKALDAMRARRDPGYGSQRIVLERWAQQQSDARATARHRKRVAAAARTSGEDE